MRPSVICIHIVIHHQHSSISIQQDEMVTYQSECIMYYPHNVPYIAQTHMVCILGSPMYVHRVKKESKQTKEAQSTYINKRYYSQLDIKNNKPKLIKKYNNKQRQYQYENFTHHHFSICLYPASACICPCLQSENRL